MAASYLSLESLAPALKKNAPILVPNNRLRNHLLRAHALQQQTQAWIKPNIQSLGQWLENQWLELQWTQLQNQGLSYSRVNIATTLQRQLLWEACIKKSALGATLLQPKPLAQQADSALKNLALWQLTDSFCKDYFDDANSNHAQFFEWMKEFNRSLTLQKCVTPETSYSLIATYLK
jgi:ATP-dependent helicase/nuclease subunit B